MDHCKNECKDEVFDDKIEPGELLEDCWFFGNLLQRKSRMMRSLSDPCTSSSSFTQGVVSSPSSPGKSYEETYESITKGGEFTPRPNSLIRAPSEPSSLERQDQNSRGNGKGISDHQRRSKSSKKKSSSKGLLRAPSLPTSLEREEEVQDEEEIEFSMGKLIRQASLNCSDSNLPPKRYPPAKGLSKSYSISRHTNRMRRKPEMEGIKLDGMEDIVKPQIPFHQQLKTQKSLADLESEELQGFKDLGFDFDKKELSPSVVSIIPGLQENKGIQEDEEKISTAARRPYLSEAWAAQSFAPPPAPPVPKWGGKKSTEDMKAQIKFWARAVASNVRQEC